MRRADRQNPSQKTPRAGGDRKTPAPEPSDTDYPEISRRMGELGLMDNPKFRAEVLVVFLQELSKTIEDLHGAIQAGDASTCEFLAHRMRGASLNLGAVRLGGIALDLEHLGQDGDLSGADSLAAASRQEFENLRAFFARLPGMAKAA